MGAGVTLPTRLPSDEEMETLRRAGAFVCSCPWDQPVHIALWDVVMCGVCGRKRLDEVIR